MAHLVKHPTLAQVMISPFMDSSPASGSVLTAQSLEPAWDSVSPSLSAPFFAPFPFFFFAEGFYFLFYLFILMFIFERERERA